MLLQPAHLYAYRVDQVGWPVTSPLPGRFDCGAPLLGGPSATPALLDQGVRGAVLASVGLPTCDRLLLRRRAVGMGLVFVGLLGTLLVGLLPRLRSAKRAAAGSLRLGLAAAALVVPSLLMTFSRYDYENAWQWMLAIAACGALLGALAVVQGTTVIGRGDLDAVGATGLILGLMSLVAVVCALGGGFGSLPAWGTEG